MIVFKIGVYIGFIVIGIVFFTDYFVNKITQLKRFHIGRWDNKKQWEMAVQKRALKWLNHTPVVRKTDNYQYILCDILKGNYKSNTIQSWQKAGLILGLANMKEEESEKVIKRWEKEAIDSNGFWKAGVDKVDFSMLGYAVLTIEENPQKIKPAMEWVLRVLEKNLCKDNMISYSQGKASSIRFVDTLGMVCPFLARYGRIYGEKKYTDLAIEQIREFRKNGLLQGSQLPCHAYCVDSGKPLGIYGWGRGTVWYMLALIDTYKELSEEDQKREMKKWIFDAANEYKEYQKEDGGFYTILQGSGQYDSSVTVGMAYYYHCCAEIFENEEYYKVEEKCIKKLMTVTMKDGAIDQCQGDTHGIGTFSQVFDVMPFAQGMCLRIMEK
mgnify:CR=1 FL=1